jgi:activator of HSP90 ATPase
MKTIQLTYQFDASPEVIYQAYLSEKIHMEFTGSRAEIFPQLGGAISTWDGYATGRFIALEPNRLIKQTWHADTWPDGLESMATITLHEQDSGTRLELIHENVPDDEADTIEQGWLDYYWEPLDRYVKSEVA